MSKVSEDPVGALFEVLDRLDGRKEKQQSDGLFKDPIRLVNMLWEKFPEHMEFAAANRMPDPLSARMPSMLASQGQDGFKNGWRSAMASLRARGGEGQPYNPFEEPGEPYEPEIEESSSEPEPPTGPNEPRSEEIAVATTEESKTVSGLLTLRR